MPVRAETFFTQSLDRSFGEVTVLEATAGKHYPLLAGKTRDREDGFNQAVMEFRRDLGCGDRVAEVVQNACNHRGPIEQVGDVRREA